jgi:hypothetical protein
MWSYYAEGHRGIVVLFNTTPEQLAKFRPEFVPVEVQYSNQFPSIKYYETPTPELIAKVVGTKAKAWEHEKEWRIVLVNHTGYVQIPHTMIGGVVFGLRTDYQVEQQIRSWTKMIPTPLQFFRIKHRRNSFELEVTPA